MARTTSGFSMKLDERLGRLPQARYRFGVRANHLSLKRQCQSDIEIAAEVDLAEISAPRPCPSASQNLDWGVQERACTCGARGAGDLLSRSQGSTSSAIQARSRWRPAIHAPTVLAEGRSSMARIEFRRLAHSYLPSPSSLPTMR
jgi:hypothetical protein